MKSPKFTSVAEYVTAQGPVKAKTLRTVIDFILTQFPELEAKISWNVPTIHRNGEYVAGVCAYQHHLTVSAWSPRIIADFRPRLGNYVVFKNCFQIPVDWTIDRKLLKDLVRARLAELDWGVFSNLILVGQRACSRLNRARKRAAYRSLVGPKWQFDDTP